MAEHHISRADILLWIDGQLPATQADPIREHLASCVPCHKQWRELETTLDGYLSEHAKLWPASADNEAALDRLEMHLVARSAPQSNPLMNRRLAYLGLCACTLLAVASYLVWQASSGPRETPNMDLTPGLALAVSPHDVCSPHHDEPQIVTASMAQAVFAEYGIRNPKPRSYEVDYLVTPALGGARDIKNLWPQPYAGGAWNARVKDALEDRLHMMVCSGELDLSVAQRELATDWVAAYRKYFGTEQPLAEHLAFRKDQPWE